VQSSIGRWTHLQPDGVVEREYRPELEERRRSDGLFPKVDLADLRAASHLRPCRPRVRLDELHLESAPVEGVGQAADDRRKIDAGRGGEVQIPGRPFGQSDPGKLAVR
jgi:hypothetical protein